jgi:hypothetical protein
MSDPQEYQAADNERRREHSQAIIYNPLMGRIPMGGGCADDPRMLMMLTQE